MSQRYLVLGLGLFFFVPIVVLATTRGFDFVERCACGVVIRETEGMFFGLFFLL